MKRLIEAIKGKYVEEIKGIIHVGAFDGREWEDYRDNGVTNVLWFEPLKAPFERLKARVDGDCICVNAALSDHNGKAAMYVSEKHPASSSLLVPYLHLKQYQDITFEQKENVELIKLDDYIKAHHLQHRYNVINIDVQGYEIKALSGATKTLWNIDCIMSEVNRRELYVGCTLVYNFDHFLGIRGFKRFETDWLEDTWGNAIYARRKCV